MTKYRLSFEIETDEDPSELLARLQAFGEGLTDEIDADFDDDTASVEEAE